MNQSSNWTGADSTLTGTINTRQSYIALYTTGDATIDRRRSRRRRLAVPRHHHIDRLRRRPVLIDHDDDLQDRSGRQAGSA